MVKVSAELLSFGAVVHNTIHQNLRSTLPHGLLPGSGGKSHRVMRGDPPFTPSFVRSEVSFSGFVSWDPRCVGPHAIAHTDLSVIIKWDVLARRGLLFAGCEGVLSTAGGIAPADFDRIFIRAGSGNPFCSYDSSHVT